MRYLLILFLSAALAQPQGQSPLHQLNDSLVGVAERLAPAVVLVVSNGYQPVQGTGGAAGVYAMQQTAGSGVILSADGYIVTNAHVVEGATRVEVQLSAAHTRQGQSILRRPGPKVPARIVGHDKETDLALLKIESNDLPVMQIADSDKVRQGQLVFALGSPAGLESSLTMGIVSAVARQLHEGDRVVYIQTDAPINPGNSGGALVDLDGRLVGINTLIVSRGGGSEGLGFAIPSNIVQFVTTRLRQQGVVVRGDIAVDAQTITPALAERLKLPVSSGVILSDVVPGGPGDTADLRPGDIVLALNGKPMENDRQFHVNVYQQKFGSVIELDVLRADRKLRKQVVVLDRQNSMERLATLVNEEQHLIEPLAVLGFAIDAEIARRLPFVPRRTHGILVARLVVTGLGPNPQLLPGDLLYELDGKPLSTLKELRDGLAAAAGGETVVFQIERAGKLRYLEYALP